MKKNTKGFTLIELLIVIAIIGVLMAISAFGLNEARKSARDTKRKAELEQIRSALALYKSDCNDYPATITFGSPLIGDGTPTSCLITNIYISEVPQDTLSPTQTYYYSRTSSTTYNLCASLEQSSAVAIPACGDNCGETCNYKVSNQ